MKKLIGLFSLLFILWWSVLADDLANVSLDYCDTPENTLQYQIDPGVETGICYTLSNRSKNTVTVKLSFLDGTFTNDEWQNKACLSDNDVENFWTYVTNYDSLITLQPWETLRKEAQLMYPKGMDGLYYGCVVYSVVEEKPADEWMGTSFSILMRRAKFIDVIVGDPSNAQERGIVLEAFTDEDGENISHNPKIRIYKDSTDGKYVMQIKVKNISRTQQDIMITWAFSNIIGYKNIFEEGRKILKWESLLITKKLDTIPVYNLKIKLDISNTPMTFGNSEPVIGYTQEKTNIWIWNTITWITLVGILLLAGIIFLLINDIKKRKNMTVKIIHDIAPAKKKPVAKKPVAKKKSIKKVTKKK